MGSIKLNFDGCTLLGNTSQLGIGGMIRDHHGMVLRVLSKPTGEGLTIEVEILTLGRGLTAGHLPQSQALDQFKFAT